MQATVDLWIIGILVTIMIAVITALATILKIAYDTSKNLNIALHGDPNNGEPGFIQRAIETHEKLSREQDQVRDILQVQGELLTELTYGVAEIAEAVAEHDDIDPDVNTERIERLRDLKRKKSDD